MLSTATRSICMYICVHEDCCIFMLGLHELMQFSKLDWKTMERVPV